MNLFYIPLLIENIEDLSLDKFEIPLVKVLYRLVAFLGLKIGSKLSPLTNRQLLHVANPSH